MRQFRFLFLFLLAGCASGPKTDPTAKTVVRAAFDIGSGATKMKVGRVTTSATGVVVDLLYPDPNSAGEVRVLYQDSLKKGGKDKKFSDEIINQGIAELKKFKALAEPYGTTEYVGVATSAFREAKNGKEALDKIAKETGIVLRILSQEEEATLGFWAAVGVAGVDAAKTVVWDIGGGSQQISMLDSNGTVSGSNNQLGSDIMKEKIRAIQKRKKSINPVGKNAAQKALAITHAEAKSVSPLVKAKVTNPETRVIGIGSVQFISIKEQVMAPEDKYYDQGMVKKALEASWDLQDDKIGGRYAENQIPNLILVLGVMEKLGITEVTPVKVNLADGLLRYSAEGKPKAAAEPAPKTN